MALLIMRMYARPAILRQTITGIMAARLQITQTVIQGIVILKTASPATAMSMDLSMEAEQALAAIPVMVMMQAGRGITITGKGHTRAILLILKTTVMI